jgi:hypothetical protein
MTSHPWPLLHVSELAETCTAGCGRRGTRVSSTGNRWCARCWDAAADRARRGGAA